VSLQGYASYYTLNLYSNFTFFLNDPINGDGIQQIDRRWYGGFDGRYERTDTLFGVTTTSTAGFQPRIDGPHVVLANQADRHLLGRTQDVNILEQSYSPYVKFALAPPTMPWLRFVTGARGDIFTYNTKDLLDGTNGPLTGNQTRALPSVKANLALGPWFKWLEAFLSMNNLLNQNYSEVQLYYTSRLPGEPSQGVAHIHFTPGAPFSVFGGLAFRF
jgi:hypothetical protein